ncbi:MAG: polyprenyl synthetase family protein [Candidatus Margulisiibacteriota bacterium]
MSSDLKQLFKPITADMDAVSVLINQSVRQASTSPAVRQVLDDILEVPGKRLRPALALFAYYSLRKNNKNDRNSIRLAAAIELIHMASLIHDDMIDHAETRHNKPAVHARWGQDIAIPAGVFLYSIALSLISEIQNQGVLRCISHTVKQLCEGEIRQVFKRNGDLISIPHYLLVLKKKTGVLFSAASTCGAYLALDTPVRTESVLALKQFGKNLGVVFQIADDYLDVKGNSEALGKKAGQDFLEGDVTLPLLYLIDNTPEPQKTALLAHMQARTLDGFSVVQRALLDCKPAKDNTKTMAFHFLEKAKTELGQLPKSVFKTALEQLTAVIQKRGFD